MAQKSENERSSQGTGSAEQTGRNRSDQQQRGMDLNKQDTKDIAQQAGVGRKQIATQKDLGAQSGRDDYAGGSDNVMDDQDTGQQTDR